MGLVIGRRGQISLEFMLVFSIMLIMLLYSARNVNFSGDSPSVKNLEIQIALEEKSIANTISDAISQVYAQGPGSKVTVYTKLFYLRNVDYLRKATGLQDPEVFITFGNYSTLGSGTYVMITGTGFKAILSGGDKNVFWSKSLYQRVLFENSSIWSPQGTVNFGSTTVNGLKISPDDLPSTLVIVVEWNPETPNSWAFDPEKGELRININPGG